LFFNPCVKKKSKKKKERTPVQEADQQAPAAQENPFDFGGLPVRDLKKNLGCG
jgi:hypothetical protein